MTAIILMIMAWTMEMPKWLSVLITVCGSIRILGVTFSLAVKTGKIIENNERRNN